ncbi:cytochrome P450 71A8-like [Salvia miltiorrhiza]|uniref:cytochrome P450 71A8-like n=1 Tax=Salvia miltiorrhiza TaxID=226208 RepID=UPI0025AB7523|nr:cytochrome P450 71A8-like [Salvia miltiorrhiza]
MDETKLHPFIFPVLISLLLLWLVTKRVSGNKNLPPSPRKLPILGNLHQLGFLPHRNLQSLAVKHGPFMLLHFGSVPVLIASTADAARDALKTHDLTFASRPQLFRAVKKFIRDGRNVGFAPYGEYWRQMRGISVIHLLSSKRVQSFRFIREEETTAFMQRIRESSGPVDFSSMVSEFTNDVICRSTFGRKYSDSENGKKVMVLLRESMELLGTVCIGDFIPWLSWVSRVNGFDKRLDRVAKELDEFLEGVIQEHVETPKRQQGQNGESFVDVLLDIHNDKAAEISIDRESIKSLLVDILGAGTDTLTTLLIWAMAELLRHPLVMEQLQNEVREVVKDKQDMSDNELEKMHYLKAVIKETFRCHPPVPLLIPRIASSDVKIKGYDIPAGTMLLTNAWAIGKDPASWDEPDKFEPGRFLNSSIDYKGLDFELIPFGAGRRGCPGIAFSAATVEFVLANLVWKFNWELPDGRKDVDMTETPAATLHKALPLLALANQYS